MSKQTAVEWLIKEIYRDLVYDTTVKWIIDKAKQMEKQQIMTAYGKGQINALQYINKDIKELSASNEYYCKTYGGNHE